MGLLDDFASATGKIGMTLAGGDPGLVTLNDQQAAALGNRSLLNMGLSMLMNSGPTYAPRNFGQILAAGLMDAQRTPEHGEAQMLAAQQAAEEMAVRRAGLQIQGFNAQRQLEMLRLMLGRIQGGDAAAAASIQRLGGGGGAGGGGSGGPSPWTGLASLIVPAESGGVADAKNPYSSARGFGQFTDETWQGFLASPEGKGYTMADRSNPAAVNAAINWYAGQNNNVFKTELGRDATEGELLASHFFGGKAAATLAANPTANLRETLVTSYGRDKAEAALAGNKAVIRPDMTNAEALAATEGMYRNQPRRVQVASITPNRATDATVGGPPPPAPPPPRQETVTDPETGLPVTRTAAASPPAAAQPGAAKPALSTTPQPPAPPQQPPAPPQQQQPEQTGPAPDTPEIAAARAQARAAALQQLKTIRASGDLNMGDKAAAIEKDLAATEEKLNEEARKQQYKIQEEGRGAAQKRAEQEHASALEAGRQEAAARLQAELKAKENEQMATIKANENAQTATLKYDTDRLTQLAGNADTARRIARDTQPLVLLAQGMGPADAFASTEFGRQVRDLAVTFKIGSPDSLRAMTNQQAWDALIGGLFQDAHVQGLGAQSDKEGEWLMKQWGSVSQSPDDRLTSLAIVRKLAEERVRDHADADAIFRRDKGLGALNGQLASRKSVFDRPPAWDATDRAGNAERQNSYVLSHPVGEPFKAYFGNSGKTYWARRKVDGSVERLAKDLEG